MVDAVLVDRWVLEKVSNLKVIGGSGGKPVNGEIPEAVTPLR
jgi:hypothetical protein